MNVLLETPRIYLREFTSDDLENIVELDSDPDVVRYIGFGNPTDKAVLKNEVLPRYLEYHRAGQGFGYWAAILKGDESFAGWFHLRPNRGDESIVELGYRLARNYWGKGYATECASALIQYGFEQLGLDRIFAHAVKQNGASISVMKKIGMHFVKEYIEERFKGGDNTAVQYVIESKKPMS